MLPFSPGFCGIFTVRQTHCGYSGSMVSTLKAFQFGNDNQRRVTLHSSNDLLSFATDWSLNLAHLRQQSNTWPDGLISRDSRRPKPTSTSGQNSQGNLGKWQFGMHLSSQSTHSSCGLDYGEDSLHATDLHSQNIAPPLPSIYLHPPRPFEGDRCGRSQTPSSWWVKKILRERGLGIDGGVAMDALRKQLDVLMGANRNGDAEEVTRKYYDGDVCRLFLAGLCPHELFQVTKMDKGPCPKVLQLRKEYEEAKAKGLDNYDRDLEDNIDRLIIECDRKIARALKRLDEEDAKAAIAISVSQVTQTPEIIELSKPIKLT
ncbi:U1 snRNP-associated protein [Sesamum alatum]|uniref:U1 snRNP-associated protein n=1 Tax=Sesamum alatum TaxID=300844 RepID=A0AAE2CN44_9LAMI|nr:U1 snRNP-associated protein [Sesamum alatum]